MSNKPTYTSITIQPADEDGAFEVWGAYTVTHKAMGTFETDGIIGHLYRVQDHYWVWINEAGHPTGVINRDYEDVNEWAKSHFDISSKKITWADEYMSPETR